MNVFVIITHISLYTLRIISHLLFYFILFIHYLYIIYLLSNNIRLFIVKQKKYVKFIQYRISLM